MEVTKACCCLVTQLCACNKATCFSVTGRPYVSMSCPVWPYYNTNACANWDDIALPAFVYRASWLWPQVPLQPTSDRKCRAAAWLTVPVLSDHNSKLQFLEIPADCWLLLQLYYPIPAKNVVILATLKDYFYGASTGNKKTYALSEIVSMRFQCITIFHL